MSSSAELGTTPGGFVLCQSRFQPGPLFINYRTPTNRQEGVRQSLPTLRSNTSNEVFRHFLCILFHFIFSELEQHIRLSNIIQYHALSNPNCDMFTGLVIQGFMAFPPAGRGKWSRTAGNQSPIERAFGWGVYSISKQQKTHMNRYAYLIPILVDLFCFGGFSSRIQWLKPRNHVHGAKRVLCLVLMLDRLEMHRFFLGSTQKNAENRKVYISLWYIYIYLILHIYVHMLNILYYLYIYMLNILHYILYIY